MKRLTLTLFLLWHVSALSQGTFTVYGTVKDDLKAPLPYVNIINDSNHLLAATDSNGRYELKLPAGQVYRLTFSYAGTKKTKTVGPASSGQRIELNVNILLGIELGDIVKQGENPRSRLTWVGIPPRVIEKFPTGGDPIGALIRTMPGVSVNNELSSQYSVRGGNYDENLVYVNDIEIYRPFLVRSGQQEGLSFVNPDMIQGIRFSAGGFESRYGDKMSSVLDITYKEPKKFAASGNVSLLGAFISAEGVGDKKLGRFTYVVGLRYRTNQYILNSLDVQGDYKPRFVDAQSFLTYKFTEKLSLGYLLHYSENRFLLSPQSQETRFGTVANAVQLYVGFGGQELMKYNTFTNGLILKYKYDRHTELKLTASIYTSNEKEFYDVEGAYRLDQLDNQLGSKTFGQAKYSLGHGYFINHARNELFAQVYNIAHRGFKKMDRHELEWGLQYQHEYVDDRLREGKYNDSAGISISPNDPGPDVILLENFLKASNIISSNRYTAYIQDNFILDNEHGLILNAGLRSNYWDFNQVNVISPRAQLFYEPNKKHNLRQNNDSLRHRDIKLKLAFGYYYQPPFYRELRNLQGKLNSNIQPQRSIHFVAGGDLNFKMWGRDFKFFTEAYFKKLDNLIPYLIDNIRVRYDAVNSSKGYAAGIDARVNGEFLEDAESWFTLSIMQTKENISYNDSFGNVKESGFIRRPTDQRVNFSVFFQDNLPSNPDYKVNLTVLVGTGLPYYLGGSYRYKEGFGIPPYKRVDIGFSKDIIKEDGPRKGKFSQVFKSATLSLEVFNLFGINNTVSYVWLKDLQNNIYGVPSYLTGRRLNIHLIMKF